MDGPRGQKCGPRTAHTAYTVPAPMTHGLPVLQVSCYGGPVGIPSLTRIFSSSVVNVGGNSGPAGE